MSEIKLKDTGYALRTPCSNCPYRTDVAPYLSPERARDLANNLRASGDFSCHKTTSFDEDGEAMRTAATQQCAGALILQEKSGQLGQSTRIAERLGLYDASRLDMDAAVYSSIEAFVSAYAQASGEADLEYCEVAADHNCENPQAYGGYGTIEYNTDAPSCDQYCEGCGNAMCSSCSSSTDGLCRLCAEDEDQ